MVTNDRTLNISLLNPKHAIHIFFCGQMTRKSDLSNHSHFFPTDTYFTHKPSPLPTQNKCSDRQTFLSAQIGYTADKGVHTHIHAPVSEDLSGRGLSINGARAG